MPTLHILTEGFSQKSFELAEGVTAVGRDEDNAIHIPDASLSGSHGEFIVTGGSVVFRDLGSTNGSFLDEQLIAGEVVLAEGTSFRLGSVRVQIGNGGVDLDRSKRSTELIQVTPAGIKPDDMKSSTTEVSSPFKPRKRIGNKIFIIVVAILFVIAIAILIYTLLKARG
jgi:pSer/pThr/pTyr-binding forkhead associated (FHA) protein